MKHYLNRAAALFFVLCVVFIPFVQQQWQLAVTRFIFLKPVQFLGSLFYKKPLTLLDFSSDTRSLLLLFGLLASLACALAFALKNRHERLLPVCTTVTIYFLAFVLLKYGLDKVFLRQFYQPAPNILYTQFGNLDKDILYWSTVGSVPVYQIITGAIEVLAAVLLLVYRTRFMGLLLGIMALVQIVIINFTFDISVKMFSVLLLAMALYAAGPQLKALLRFLTGQKPILLPLQKSIALPVYIKAAIKCFTVGLIVLQTLAPQFSGAAPNPLTGAYQVREYIHNGQAQEPCNTRIKRIFIHPKNYFILQDIDDKMTDFHFTQDKKAQVLILTDFIGNEYKVEYQQKGKDLIFNFSDGRKVITTPLPWRNMPALQNQFHFMVDDIE
jgi:hypothetical protein